jgi:hypothetical protein
MERWSHGSRLCNDRDPAQDASNPRSPVPPCIHDASLPTSDGILNRQHQFELVGILDGRDANSLSRQDIGRADRIVVGNHHVGTVDVATVGAEGQAHRPGGVLRAERRAEFADGHVAGGGARGSPATRVREQRRSRMVLCWGLGREGTKKGRSASISHPCSRARYGLQLGAGFLSD